MDPSTGIYGVSQAQHSRAKELFLEAVELTADRREAYLTETCGGDSELRSEVESLLVHHSPDSLFVEAPSRGAGDRGTSVLPAARGTNGTASFGGLVASRFVRLIWTLAAASFLVLVGFLIHSRIERALLDVRADELKTVLDADINALDLWVTNLKALHGLFAEDPRVVRSMEELLAAGEDVEERVEARRSSPAWTVLADVVASFLRNTGNVGVEIIDEHGEFVFSLQASLPGMELHRGMSRELSAALRGQTIFARPYRIEDLVEGETSGTMYSFALGPLRDDDGRIIAAIAIVQRGYGPGSISSILEVSQLGETGESYAFDAEGLMLSESRFTDELRRIGQIPSAVEDGREWEMGAQLNVQVRDPGGELAAGHQPEMEVGAWPLTRLAALAIAARDKANPDEVRGIVLEPYRNYRGVEVVGAWRWLPEHGFAVATEIEAEEALAPLVYVEMLFGVLFVLLSAFVATTLISAFSVVRLRSRVQELKELGPYKLKSPIAQGGMGVVYLAEHALLKRRTAVKVLSGELSKTNVARFEREVSLASKLTHPNTIEIYDYGRSPEGVFYCAMEYVEGPTLSALVTSFGPPSPERVVYILRQVCASLGEAHREGLVHRDIKPQNIMLCTRGGEHDVVKVLDFGLAKDVTRADSGELSRGIHIGGTPVYMAPERLTSPKLLDARVDIYSLGCVAYYLLSGIPVFEPKDDVDLVDKIVNAEPRPLHEICPQPVTGALEQLVTDCLEKDPQDRPPTVFAILDRLEALDEVGRWTQEEAAQWWKQVFSNPRPT